MPAERRNASCTWGTHALARRPLHDLAGAVVCFVCDRCETGRRRAYQIEADTDTDHLRMLTRNRR